MTGDEFAAAYARRSGVTVEWLAAHGRAARPCGCQEDGCEGWQMAHLLRIPVSTPSAAADLTASLLYGDPPARWGATVRGEHVELVLDATPRSPERIAALVKLVEDAGAASVTVTTE